MAVKARNRKKKQSAENYSKAARIKCCFCELEGKCSRQAYKEDSERRGFMTFCTFAPNVVKKRNKKTNIKK